MQINKAIILLGIKHSGKSTQGKLLAKELNCPCLDVDDAIAKLFKKTAREIYTEKGPVGFMYAEEVACQKIAETYKNRQIIISTGGGICDNAPALIFLRPLGEFVYLQVDERTVCDRIIKKATQLPDGRWINIPAYIAIKNPKDEVTIRKLFHSFYEERSEAYKQIADVTVSANEKVKEDNTKLILSVLGKD